MGSIKGPLWTEFVLQKGGQDPLAMGRRAANRMSLELFWGMTVNTQVARYYAFYPWVVEQSQAQDRSALLDDIIRAEKAYAIACLLAHDGERCVNGLVGADLVDSFGIEGRDSYTLPAVKWFAREASGFGQLYQGPLFRLDLLESADGMIATTARGRRLAQAYKRNVAETEYVARYFDKDIVPKSVLTPYGHQACPCALVQSPNEELKLLRELFFESRDERRECQLSHSLCLVLDIIRSCTRIDRAFDEHCFRIAVFYREIADAESKTYHRYHPPEDLEEVRERWRLFQAENYFVFVLETFLSALLDAAENQSKQKISLNLLVKKLEDARPLSLLGDYLGVSFDARSLAGLTLRQAARTMLMRLPATEFNAESSHRFDNNTTAYRPWSEEQIAQRLAPLNKGRVKPSERIMGALALLLTLYVRFYHYHKRRPNAWDWYLVRSSRDDLDLSLSKWMYQNPDLLRRTRSVLDFLVSFLDVYVLRRQLKVAEDRRYDVAWFSEADLSVILARKPGRRLYRFNYPYESASPHRLSSKLSNALDILHTLGYCESDSESEAVRLTQRGLNRLSCI
jgi:hypothetical protein